MKKSITYKQFISRIIILTIIAIGLLFLFFAFFIQFDSINNNLKKENALFSDLIFENLYTTMKSGGDINEINNIIDKLEKRVEHSEINIYRTPQETDQEHLKNVFTTKETSIFKHDNHLDFAKPIIFQNECTKCHTTVTPGDVAAIIQVETPYLEINISIKDILISITFLFISSIIIIFLVWYVYFKKVFISHLEKIVKQMLKINSHDDLDELIDLESNIKELKDIEVAFNQQAVLLKNTYNKIEKLSITDSLTKVYNRRKFIDDIEELMIVCRRYNHVFTIVSIDLNKFKPINDTYGHNIGDLVLKEFAVNIKKNIRTSDKFYRVGGDEFIILLNNTKIVDSNVVINNLKNEINKINIIINGNKIDVSASFGASEFTSSIKSVEQLLIVADKEMYKDKLNIKQGF